MTLAKHDQPSHIMSITLAVIVVMTTMPEMSRAFQDPSSCGQQKVTVTGQSRIVGGKPAEDGEWPWQAQMIRDGSGICGASLVDPYWILSAAHCLGTVLNQPGLFQFRMGSNKFSQTGSSYEQIRTAEKIFMHPSYVINGPNNDADMALFKLTEPFELTDYVQTVCLPTVDMAIDFPEGTLVTVTGWGSTGPGSYYSEDLLEVSLPITSHSGCKAAYGQHGIEITDNMLCAGEAAGGKDSCQGDSGGPLVSEKDGKWYQLGVVSFGIGCAEAEYPGVYARVTAFQDWIAPIYDDGEPTTQENCTGRDLFTCLYGGCLPKEVKCNKVAECYSGSDESYCDYPYSFFYVTQGIRLTEASITRQEFVWDRKDCATSCLASPECSAFDAQPDQGGFICSMAAAGYTFEDSPSDPITHFELVEYEVSAESHNIRSGWHGYFAPSTNSTETSFLWRIFNIYQINVVQLQFTRIQMDEEIGDGACSNSLTVQKDQYNTETFCLYELASEGSFKYPAWTDNLDTTELTFNTLNPSTNSFLAEFTTEWSCDQTIDLTATETGSVNSPNFPGTYPPLVTCNVLLKAPYGSQVKLTLENFDSGICPYGDSVYVYDTYEGAVFATLADCNDGGLYQGNVLVSTKGEMKVVFITDKDSTIYDFGYSLRYETLAKDPDPTSSGNIVPIRKERDTYRTALICVAVGAGIVIFCLIVWTIKLSARVSKPKNQSAPNALAVVSHRPMPPQQEGQVNSSFHM